MFGEIAGWRRTRLLVHKPFLNLISIFSLEVLVTELNEPWGVPLMIRNRSRFQLASALAVFFASALNAMNSSAALLVYEGFDYSAGTSLRTQSGGTGFAGAWANTGNATETATSPGLGYGNLTAAGNKATLNGQQTTSTNGNSAFLTRDLSQSFGADGTTVWLSFISQRTGSKSAGGTAQPLNYQRVFSLSLFSGSATEQASVGELSNDPADVWALNPDATTIAPSAHTTTPLDTQSFLLLRIDNIAGTSSDKAYLWVNPDLSLGEPAIGTEAATITDELSFNRVRLTVGGSQNSGATLAASGLFDEIRIGDTFADVTPVPEPNCLLAVLTCLAYVLPVARIRMGSR
jgi:hypothetical protein